MKAGNFVDICNAVTAVTADTEVLRCKGHSRIIFRMTEKEMVLKTGRELPDDCSIDEIADRIKFLAAVQRVSISWTTAKAFPTRRLRKSGLMAYKLMVSGRPR